MLTRMLRVGQMLLWSSYLLLAFALISVHRVEAQPSGADTVRFLEQSTFAPTSQRLRVRTAIYLIATSPQYQVQR